MMTTKFMRILWMMVWFLEQLGGGVVSVWAQQQISGQGSDQGGPLTGQAAEGVSPTGTDRRVESVQIGTPLYEKPEGSPLETRVTVRVKEAPLSTFLDTISAQAKVNFILTEGLEQKRITAFLRAVTVREALQILLQIKGLTYQRVGKSNTYIIMRRSAAAPNLITKIYTLNYVSMVSLGTLSSDRATIGFQSQNQQQGGGGSGGGTSSGAEAQKEGGDSGIAIVQVVKSVLTKLGRISIEPRTNSLIVTDIAEVFPNVEQIIAELDKKAPQVLIEAQIVEINTDKINELGISWGGTSGELGVFTGPIRNTVFPLREGVIQDGRSTWDLFNVGDNTMSGFSQTITGGIVDLSKLTVLLKALIQRNEGRFLGKPKVLTLNNKGAIIQIIRNQAIGIKQNISSGGGGGVSSSTTEAEREITGLTLVVTPQINKEGYITLLLQPTFLDVQDAKISGFKDPISRGISSLVRVKNGQTVVVGGLLSTREDKTVRKVPLLGYIPIIGWLFTSVSSRRTNTDLVIFITPTIVQE
ncbi:MAG: hypothetical protein HY400_04680 [Elusimicrobia bacterium]|nr:hypothetical protein [Elusimicrobiota bacterium]